MKPLFTRNEKIILVTSLTVIALLQIVSKTI